LVVFVSVISCLGIDAVLLIIYTVLCSSQIVGVPPWSSGSVLDE